MKKLIILLFGIFIIFINYSYSQDKLWGNAHQWVTKEAWELVRLQFGSQITGSYMDNNFGTYGDPCPSINYQRGTIIAGTTREDDQDIVYHQTQFCEDMHSCTHFWNADDGNGAEWEIFGCKFENSLHKFYSYINGKTPDNVYFLDLGLEPNFTLWYPSYDNLSSRVYVTVTYGSLVDVLKDPSTIIVKKYTFFNGGGHDCNTPILDFFAQHIVNPDGIPYDPQYLQSYFKKVGWEILGRMCHLLEDNSVPAHAHNDDHNPDWPNYDPDYYEYTYLGYNGNYNLVDRNTALNEGGLVGTRGLFNPLRTSMYVQNQIADRFPSNDEDGDLNWYSQAGYDDYNYINSEITTIYNSLSNPYVSTVHFGDNPPSGLMEKILNKSYLYSIRNVAGFLWWFYCLLEDIPIDPPIFSNFKQTPSVIFPGQTGTVLCSLSQGTPYLVYDWSYENKPSFLSVSF